MEALYILLGWLLGILSPGIMNKISNYYKKDSLQRIIINELKDIRKRLLWIPFRIHPDYGTLDKNLFIWLKKQTKNFTEIEIDDNRKESFEKLKLKFEENEEIEELLKRWNFSSQKDNPAFHFKKMETGIIDSNLINIGILDNEFLTKLLEVKFQLNAFNEEIQSVNEYLKMTFNSNITGANHQIIKEEIKNKNLYISKKAIYIVEKINRIVDTEK